MTAPANILEVFSGIQGEGIYVGRRQLFVRFTGCNLSCRYCDTPEAATPVLFAHMEREPGSRTYELTTNPLLPRDLAARLASIRSQGPCHSVSLTGGEPLLSADFIAELIPLCNGARFYLDTNGTLPRELEKVVGLVDTIAMDIKLASSADLIVDRAVHREFLAVASKTEVFVKVVVSDATTARELAAAAELVASVSRAIPFVIQPVTPAPPRVLEPEPEQVFALQARALALLDDVRVIPQVHKLIGQK